MIAKALVIISSLLFLAACQTSTKENFDLNYNPATDAQIEYIYQGMPQQLVAVNEGYYFINDYYLYYMDKQSMQPVLLDSNPRSDCLATSNVPENCSAFIFKSGFTKFLSHYNNKLYTLQEAVDLKSKLFEFDTYQLAEISLEGQTRKVVLEFDEEPTAISIHRDFLYVAFTTKNTNGENEYRLQRHHMKQLTESPEILFTDVQAVNGYISDIYPYGKFIYFLEMQVSTINCWRYNLETKQLDKMFISENDTSYGYIMGIHNNEVIHTLSEDSITDTEAWQARTTSLTSDNETILPLDPQALSYYYQSPSDDNIYMMPNWGYQEWEPELYATVTPDITVYNRNYERIAVVDMPFLSVQTTVLPGDEHYLFAKTRAADEELWYILDKSSIGTDKAEFQELLRTPATSPSIYYEH